MEDARDPSSDMLQYEAASGSNSEEQNLLLRSLSSDDYEWLRPQLTLEEMPTRRVLIEPNVPITDLWFLRKGVASIIAAGEQGDGVEAGTVGFEGFVGLPVLLEDRQVPNRVVIQVPGLGWRIPADDFRGAVDERPAIRTHCLKYAAYYVAQVQQSVACNALHTLDQRCARWLLMTVDRVHGDSFELTQEFLAMMLGVRRAGVSVAMSALQREDIVRYSRGHVTVVDRAGLERRSCVCYRITRETLDRVFA